MPVDPPLTSDGAAPTEIANTAPPPPPSAPSPALKKLEHQLTRMLALSLDGAASPTIRLKQAAQKEGDAPYGWGFAWYPGQTSCAMVIKDPTTIGDNAMTKLLSDWERFESTVFVCHLRGAARTLEEQETQPFSKGYAGRDFVLAHNGDLFAELDVALPLGTDPTFEPIGRTDSEHAFSWLLTNMRTRGARQLADIGWLQLHEWLGTLDALGTANFLFTDGVDLCAYRDYEGYNGLGWSRVVPPYDTTILEAEDFSLDIDDVGDRGRSMVIVSTRPIDNVPFVELRPGQLLVFRRGALMFDSHAELAQNGNEAPLPSLPVPAQLKPGPFETQLQTPQHAVQPVPVVPPPPGLIPDAPTDPGIATDMPPPGPLPVEHAPILRAERLPRPVDLPPSDARILSVVHDTVYRYNHPVERSQHVYRLRPVHDLAQALLAHQLEISVDGHRRDYEDVFGNAATRIEIETPYTELRITSRSIIGLNAGAAPHRPEGRRRQTLPLVWMPWQRQMMLPYLLPPELPETQLTELNEFAMSFVERQDNDVMQTLLDMNLTIYRDFQYVSGSTTLQTTPFDVYVSRKGVCQDFANLLICMARLLSIPARYRVGYIYTGAHYENKVQSDASHAWAELYLPQVGWQGFDPTNGCLVGRDHVRVAAGRNYRDATPTSGTIYRGGGSETLTIDVRVEEG